MDAASTPDFDQKPRENEQELSDAFSPLKRRVDPFQTPRPRLDAEADLKTPPAGAKRQKS